MRRAAAPRRALYVDDPPSERHEYLFHILDKTSYEASTVWREGVDVDEEKSPLVAAVVYAAKLVGATAMLVNDDSDDEDAERDLDASCSIAQCAGLLGVPLARVYPPTPGSVVCAIAGGSPVLVVHAGVPCVLHTVIDTGEFGGARFDTCVASPAQFTPRDVRYMFGFWAPAAGSEAEAESAAGSEAALESEAEVD